jgi:hypothetical protein
MVRAVDGGARWAEVFMESVGGFGKEGSIIRVHKTRHSRTLPVIPGVAGTEFDRCQLSSMKRDPPAPQIETSWLCAVSESLRPFRLRPFFHRSR